MEDARLDAFEGLECKAYQCAMMADENPAYQKILIKMLESLDPTDRYRRKETVEHQNLSIAMQINNMTPAELERLTPIVPPLPSEL